MHTTPSTGELLFFDPMPEALPLYLELRKGLLARFSESGIKVSKTQISFRSRTIFAMASLPLRRMKGFPPRCLVVSFGLPERKVSPRIPAAAEPYPNRWTHHMPITSPEDLDAEFWAWIAEAQLFSTVK